MSSANNTKTKFDVKLINNYLIYSRIKIQSEILLLSFEDCIKNFKSPSISESERKCLKKMFITRNYAIENFH